MTREQKKLVSALKLFAKAKDADVELADYFTGVISVGFSPSATEGKDNTTEVHLRKKTLLELADALGAEVRHRTSNWTYNGKNYVSKYVEFDYEGLNVFAIEEEPTEV